MSEIGGTFPAQSPQSRRAESIGSIAMVWWHACVFIGWVLVCFSAAVPAMFITIGAWHAALHKPTWYPPSWIFGVVWTVLYSMMALAAWLVWRQGGWAAQRRTLLVFLAQLVLNALWTPLFFGMHLVGAALVDLVALWFTLAVTIVLFRRVGRVPGLLLAPYLVWTTFAVVLNFVIWRMNA